MLPFAQGFISGRSIKGMSRKVRKRSGFLLQGLASKRLKRRIKRPERLRLSSGQLDIFFLFMSSISPKLKGNH